MQLGQHNQDPSCYDFSKHKEKWFRIMDLLNARHKNYMKREIIRHFSQAITLLENGRESIENQIQGTEAILLTPVVGQLQYLMQELQTLSLGLDDKFLLFIVGMGNYGKSTMINALLEQEAADVDFLPKTWKIDIFQQHDSTNFCRIIYRDGRVLEMEVDEAKQLIKEEEKKAKLSLKLIKDKKKEMADEWTTEKKIKEIIAFLKDKYLYVSDIVEVQWPVRANSLSGKFRLVDTPGLVQENLSGETEMRLRDYYHKADGVIWMIDATVISSKKTNELVADLKVALEQVGGSTNNVIAVLNRMDLVQKNGGEEAVRVVIQEAKSLFGEYFHEFIPVSAKEAWDGVKLNQKEFRDGSGIHLLYDTIDRRFYRRARAIQLESKTIGFKQMIHEVLQEDGFIKVYTQRLEADQEKYRLKETQVNRTVEEIRERYKKELEEITSAFSQEADARIEQHAAKLFDIEWEQSQTDFIRNTIFCVDELQPRIERFIRYWKTELEKKLQILLQDVQFQEYEHISRELMERLSAGLLANQSVTQAILPHQKDVSTRQIDLPARTEFDMVEILLGPLIGTMVGGMLKSLTKGIKKLFMMGGLKSDLRAALRKYINEMKESLENDLAMQLTSFGLMANQTMNQSYERLHGPYESSVHVRRILLSLLDELAKPFPMPNFPFILTEEKKKADRPLLQKV